MTAIPADPQSWSRRRLSVTVGLLVILQFGLIWWLGGRPTTAVRPKSASLRLTLPVRPASELTLVSDPTLFSRPNPHGFSGQAWMTFPPIDYTNVDWAEPARLLQPSVAQLGAVLREFVQTNPAGEFQAGRHPEPQLEHTEFYPMLNLSMTQSTLRIEGDLAKRPLEQDLALKSWAPTNQIVLRNSEVLVGVAPDGKVLYVVPLAQSELKEADDEALALARTARFEPLPAEIDDRSPSKMTLTWGRLIFQWQTVAPPATNAPATGL